MVCQLKRRRTTPGSLGCRRHVAQPTATATMTVITMPQAATPRLSCPALSCQPTAPPTTSVDARASHSRNRPRRMLNPLEHRGIRSTEKSTRVSPLPNLRFSSSFAHFPLLRLASPPPPPLLIPPPHHRPHPARMENTSPHTPTPSSSSDTSAPDDPTTAAWAHARAAYLSGESSTVVAARLGVSRSTLQRRAAAEGWRRCDQPRAAVNMSAASSTGSRTTRTRRSTGSPRRPTAKPPSCCLTRPCRSICATPFAARPSPPPWAGSSRPSTGPACR